MQSIKGLMKHADNHVPEGDAYGFASCEHHTPKPNANSSHTQLAICLYIEQKIEYDQKCAYARYNKGNGRPKVIPD